jgi:hypothetical protein
MLTCACGARFEVEDTFAGQEVGCPECQQPVKVPARARVPPRTSGYALASVVVALVGAFTPATPVAILLGIAALVSISRNRGRLTGAGFAIFGIILGFVFGGLTLFSLSKDELFGLGGWMRERTLADQIDTSGPLEVVDAAKGFAITRPSEKWGQVPGGRFEDPAISGLQKGADLLLLQVARYAFLDVRSEPARGFGRLDQWEQQVLDDFQPRPRVPPGRRPFPANPDDDDEDDNPFRPPVRASLRESRELPQADGVQGREMVVDVQSAGQAWRFLVRLYRRGGGPVYVVRAYTQARRYDRVEHELRQALDSFRILPGR